MAASARNDAARLAKAARYGAVAKSAVEQKLGEMRSAGAGAGVGASQAAAAKARREPLEKQLTQSSILAPFDGVVTAIKAREGQIARKDEPLARLFDPSDLLFRFAVPKEWRKQVRVGARVELRIEGVERTLWATIETISDQEAPLNFAVVEANIDDSKLAPDEVRITSSGRVSLADNKVAARKAVR
jgi:multidrug efflux pump subunit AcrA (membrane-fusion protein)